MRVPFALLFCIAFSHTHDFGCNPHLKLLKSQISKKINNALYDLYSLETQARTNFKNLKQTLEASDYDFCHVEDKLSKLSQIIGRYQEFYERAKPGDDFSQIDSAFVKLRDEIFRINNKLLNKEMLSPVKILLFVIFSHQVSNVPINYFEASLVSIKANLTKSLGDTFDDIIIVKTNTRAVASEAIRSVAKCPQFLQGFCAMEKQFANLERIRDKFSQLYDVACRVEDLCQKLNPLESQNFEKCTIDKIIDLDHQTRLVSQEFAKTKKQLFQDHDFCIRNLLNGIVSCNLP
ncbi:hypothetical protein TcasGA2_TC032934 [Tribolium castaneum]|uniref:Protein TsetseEP domain-containing protein n=1 Tax=Tribolium castaneum TaxID=7070 RepID=A0A139WJL5_TRICA|nr:hypothetical protein TcasGA2_TC032934 [Tribolium castaneum]